MTSSKLRDIAGLALVYVGSALIHDDGYEVLRSLLGITVVCLGFIWVLSDR